MPLPSFVTSRDCVTGTQGAHDRAKSTCGRRNSLMFLRSKRVGFYGGILKNLKNRKLNFIFNAPTMYFTGKLHLFHLLRLQAYQRARIHESSRLRAVAPISFVAREEMSACTLWVEVNWSPVYSHPLHSGKNMERVPLSQFLPEGMGWLFSG